jgi:hypothetical protein
MGAPAGMFGGDIGDMASMGVMGLGGFRGVYGGASAPMTGMGAPPGGVYGWEHHRGDSWPPWIILYLLQVMVPMRTKKKMEIILIMWMSDNVFAFMICKFVLNFVMWICTMLFMCVW